MKVRATELGFLIVSELMTVSVTDQIAAEKSLVANG